MENLPQDCAVDAQGLSKRFGKVEAVKNVSISVAPGEAVGLLGPNGAGKSTTLSMLMGLRAPDAGTANIFGFRAGSDDARRLVGATPQATGFPDQLSPRELLSYTAARYGMRADLDGLTQRFGLEKLLDRRVAGFSGGEMRRVSLALAFVGNPRLVFLDEPTTGLDSDTQEAFQAAARDYVAMGGALVLTSHQWDDIETICSKIALIDQGESVLSGDIASIRERISGNRIRFRLSNDHALPDWLAASRDGNDVSLDATESDTILKRMVSEAVPFSSLTIEPLKLKDIIRRIRAEEALQ